jgi:tetratricopeptide (TPR) repeat protein
MKRLILLVCASVMLPTLAAAQPKSPDDWYKEGENKYNLGDFPGAVDAFKKGFELETSESKKAAYLFNVAQAYRMAKDCYQAQFFYKRYLALKENDTKKPLKEEKRKEIEDRIRELDDCAKQQEAIRSKPPDKDPDATGDKGTGDKGTGDNGTGDKGKVVAGGGGGEGDGGEGEGQGDDGIVKGTTPAAPRVFSVRAFGGGAKINTGDLKVPVQATFGLLAGYPLALNDKLILELGAGFTFTPVPYEDAMSQSRSAKLIGLVANVGGTYAVASKIGLRADLGVGALLFSGVSMSPFTDNRQANGALTMFHLRVGLSLDYAITPNFIVTAMPIAFSYSPAHKGLKEDIKSITAIDFMVGLGYRM